MIFPLFLPAAVSATQIDLTPLANSRLLVPGAFMLAIEMGEEGKRAAWPESYQPSRPYEGYFDHRKCYAPPDNKRDAFVPAASAGTDHGCDGKTWSGNFLNWASMTVLDVLRYGLGGGYRVVDEAERTELQMVDIGARQGEASGLIRSMPASTIRSDRVTPFQMDTVYLRNCRGRIQVHREPIDSRCSASTQHVLSDLPLRVSVCDASERGSRVLCQIYPVGAKPEGMLHRLAQSFRIGLMTDDDKRTGLAPRAIGSGERRTPDWLRTTVEQREWDPTNGVMRRSRGNDLVLMDELHSYDGERRERLATPWVRAIQSIETNEQLPVCRSTSVLLVRPQGKAAGDASAQADSWRTRVRALERDSDGKLGNPLRSAGWTMDDNGLNLLANALRANLQERRIRSFVLQTGTSAETSPATSLFALLARYGGFEDANADGNPFRTVEVQGMPERLASRAEWDANLDDLSDALLGASDGSVLLARLRALEASLMEAQAARQLSLPLPALPHADQLYVAQHHPQADFAALVRYATTLEASGRASRQAAAGWQAQIPASASRKVFTSTAVAAGSTTGLIELTWNGLSPAQQTLLSRPPRSAGTDTNGSSRLSWVRGDIDPALAAAAGLRVRGSALARPTDLAVLEKWSGKSHVAMSSAHGMLHLFDSGTGVEAFAFLPSAALAALPALAQSGSSVAEVETFLVTGTLELDGRRTPVVAGALGGGTRGLYALAPPAAEDTGPRLLADFTSDDHAALGSSLSAPQLVRVGVQVGEARGEKPYLLASSGINGQAAIILLALDKPPGEAWREGQNFHVLQLPADANPAGVTSHLGPVSVVAGTDGRLLHAWAGDPGGRIWRFSFKPDRLAKAGFSVGVEKLFSAVDANGVPQAVTIAPRVAWGPDNSFLLAFGTGRLLNLQDLAPGGFRRDSLYVVYDRPGSTGPALRSQLKARTASANGTAWQISGDRFVYGAQSRGWYLDLPATGERWLATPELIAGRLVAGSTVLPADPCQPWRGRVWNLDVLTGLSSGPTGTPSTTAQLRRLIVFTQQQSSPMNAFGRAGVRLVHGIHAREPGAQGRAADTVVTDAQPVGRLSWRELFNWRVLYEMANDE